MMGMEPAEEARQALEVVIQKAYNEADSVVQRAVKLAESEFEGYMLDEWIEKLDDIWDETHRALVDIFDRMRAELEDIRNKIREKKGIEEAYRFDKVKDRKLNEFYDEMLVHSPTNFIDEVLRRVAKVHWIISEGWDYYAEVAWTNEGECFVLGVHGTGVFGFTVDYLVDRLLAFDSLDDKERTHVKDQIQLLLEGLNNINW